MENDRLGVTVGVIEPVADVVGKLDALAPEDGVPVGDRVGVRVSVLDGVKVGVMDEEEEATGVDDDEVVGVRVTVGVSEVAGEVEEVGRGEEEGRGEGDGTIDAAIEGDDVGACDGLGVTDGTRVSVNDTFIFGCDPKRVRTTKLHIATVPVPAAGGVHANPISPAERVKALRCDTAPVQLFMTCTFVAPLSKLTLPAKLLEVKDEGELPLNTPSTNPSNEEGAERETVYVPTPACHVVTREPFGCVR